jgi:hypothetical protein
MGRPRSPSHASAGRHRGVVANGTGSAWHERGNTPADTREDGPAATSPSRKVAGDSRSVRSLIRKCMGRLGMNRLAANAGPALQALKRYWNESVG